MVELYLVPLPASPHCPYITVRGRHCTGSAPTGHWPAALLGRTGDQSRHGGGGAASQPLWCDGPQLASSRPALEVGMNLSSYCSTDDTRRPHCAGHQ